MVLIVLDIEIKKMKEQKYKIEYLVILLTFVKLLLTWMLYFHVWLQNEVKF